MHDDVVVRLQQELHSSIDRRTETGPFDIFGDIHGCAEELIELMGILGYRVASAAQSDDQRTTIVPPNGRRAVFVGDLVDRGPRSPQAVRIVMNMVAQGHAFCVPGNHDARFLRWLQGRSPKLTHGLDATVAQMQAEPPEFHAAVRSFLETLPSHLQLDRGRLVIAHAGIQLEMIGSTSATTRHFCLYGDTNGIDDEGLPIRYNWAAAYDGAPSIVYGHTPIADMGWLNNTLCIDTGCCFGGRLTALRWPEREIVSVPARATYAPPRRPFGHPPLRPPA